MQRVISPWHSVTVIASLDKRWMINWERLYSMRHWCECNISSEGHLWKQSPESDYVFLFATAEDAIMFKLANDL
jgi:hypothetical protein